MGVEDATEAMDVLDEVRDCVMGMAETLRLRGASRDDGNEDYLSRMLANEAYSQADALEAVGAWLAEDGKSV